jgi:hypothetical protein
VQEKPENYSDKDFGKKRLCKEKKGMWWVMATFSRNREQTASFTK